MSVGMWWVESVGAVGEWDESRGLGARFFLPLREQISSVKPAYKFFSYYAVLY